MVVNQTFLQIVNFFFLTCWLITVLFSLTVLITIVRHWRTRCRSIINLLTCNSCVALIFYVITLFIQTPTAIQSMYYIIPEPNLFLCKTSACLATFSTIAVACSYLIYAMSRFFITILYKYRYLLTFRFNWFMIIISWISSGIIAGCMFISPLAYQYEPESHYCTLTTKNFLTSFLVSMLVAIVNMIAMIILYGIILYHTVQHTRINRNSASTLQAKRNKKVFTRIFIFVGIFGIGGLPYFLCAIINHIDRAPWPLYSIAFFFMAFACAISSIALLVTNDQVKEILLGKLAGRQQNTPNNIAIIRTNQTLPYPIEMRTIRALPTIC